MKLTLIGASYVGLVSGACFAEMGNTVVCFDNDARKIELLRAGRVPFYEPGLQVLITSNQSSGRLNFVTSLSKSMVSDIYFIAVGTPPQKDGSADLTHVLEVARELGRHLERDATIVNKSTVPVGTAERVRAVIQEELGRRSIKARIQVVSNPEFLKEGDAVNDFMRPDRVIIGVDSENTIELMRRLYAPFTRNHERLLVMGIRDAELTKYAANAMLATRISFMNEIANICERLGVDVENVRRGIGSDSRIGHAFIYPGCGYGGACFPKDMKALIRIAEDSGVTAELLLAAEARNSSQKKRLFEKIQSRFGTKLDGFTFGIWGLAFKPGTDDLREAPSLDLIESLIKAGARVKAYDPIAMHNARHVIHASRFESGQLMLVEHQYDAPAGADALVLVTEWKPFRNPDFEILKKVMRKAVIFDGRNQYEPHHVRDLGFEYFGIGR